MGVTNHGQSGLALLLSGSIIDRPAYCAIGSGSGTVALTNGSLFAENNRNIFTTTDSSTQKHVIYTTDFNSIELSGTQLTEFGVYTSGTSPNGGTLYNREQLTGSIVFDGTIELQVQVNFEVF